MSYHLRVVALSEHTLRRRLDGDDARVSAQIRRRCARARRTHDAAFHDAIAAGDPSMDDALDALLFGEPIPEEAAGYVYGYALIAIAEVLGHPLHANSFSSIRWSWLERVDQELEAAGAPHGFRAQAMVTGSVPGVSLPPIADFPSLGWTPSETLRDAAAWFESSDRPGDPHFDDLHRWLHETPPGWGWLGAYS